MTRPALTPLAGVVAVELGELLASAIESVVEAQSRLDADAMRRTEEFFESADDDLIPPPLWYTCRDVAVEIELSARVEGRATALSRPALLCRTVDPTRVALYGYQASAGLRLRLHLEGRGPLPVTVED